MKKIEAKLSGNSTIFKCSNKGPKNEPVFFKYWHKLDKLETRLKTINKLII